MKKRAHRILCLLGVAALAGCGGGSRAGIAGGPGLSPLPPASGTTGASIVIKIPHRDNARAIARYLAHYLSPATNSIAIAITDSAKTVTNVDASLSVTAPGTGPNPTECTSSALSTICTITLALAPGSYSGSFTTYDGPLVGGVPTGNKLSINQAVPFTIVAGKLNSLSVSLAAIPAAVTVAVAPGERWVRGDAVAGFALAVNRLKHAFDAYAVDADGDTIIGPGAPTFTVAAGGDKGADVIVTPPAKASPNSFALETTTPLAEDYPYAGSTGTGFATLTVTAVPPSGSGVTCTAATCSTNVPLSSRNVFFVTSNGTSSLVLEGENVPARTTALTSSTAAVDASGNIFFAGFMNQTSGVYEWSPPYVSDPTPLFHESNTFIEDLALDSADGVYFEDERTIYRSLPPYAQVKTLLSGFEFFQKKDPAQNHLVVDKNGVIIAADNQAVTLFSADNSTAQQTIAVAGGEVTLDGAGELIVAGPDGNNTDYTSYVANDVTKQYVKGTTNSIDDAGNTAMRSTASTLFVLVPGGLETFALPLTTAAPTILPFGVYGSPSDFQLTSDGGNAGFVQSDSNYFDQDFDIEAAAGVPITSLQQFGFDGPQQLVIVR